MGMIYWTAIHAAIPPPVIDRPYTMSTSSINTPAPLVVGDTATAVVIGRGGAITVDNTAVGSAGAVTISGPLTVAGALAGASLATGAVVCTSLADAGALQATSASLGALTCSSIASAGDTVQPRYALRVCRTAPLSITSGGNMSMA